MKGLAIRTRKSFRWTLLICLSSQFWGLMEIRAEEIFELTRGSTFEVSVESLTSINEFEKKPRVYISEGDLGKHKKSLKVIEFSETKVTCVLSSSVDSGTYSLFVRPKAKGKKLKCVKISESFTVKIPSISQ